MLRLHAHKYLNSISFSTDAETCTSCRCSNTNGKFFHTSDFPDKFGFKTIPPLFSRNRLSTSTVFGSDISLRQDSALYNWVYWRMSIRIVPALCQTIKSLFLKWKTGWLQRCQLLMRCHLNVTVLTSQHSMWWHGQCLWCACLPFTTSSSKTIAVVKFRRIDVFMRGHVSEKWDNNGWWPSATAACCKTAQHTTILMAACPQLMRRALDSRASVLTQIRHPPHRLIYTENYTGDTE